MRNEMTLLLANKQDNRGSSTTDLSSKQNDGWRRRVAMRSARSNNDDPIPFPSLAFVFVGALLRRGKAVKRKRKGLLTIRI